jgi:hypothetical protein
MKKDFFSNRSYPISVHWEESYYIKDNKGKYVAIDPLVANAKFSLDDIYLKTRYFLSSGVIDSKFILLLKFNNNIANNDNFVRIPHDQRILDYHNVPQSIRDFQDFVITLIEAYKNRQDIVWSNQSQDSMYQKVELRNSRIPVHSLTIPYLNSLSSAELEVYRDHIEFFPYRTIFTKNVYFSATDNSGVNFDPLSKTSIRSFFPVVRGMKLALISNK